MGEHRAFLCKQSGKIYWHSELSDSFDELPDLTTSTKSVCHRALQCSQKARAGFG
jgi:hypothetical protein